MSIFDRLKNKNNNLEIKKQEKEISQEKLKDDNYSIIELNNYMLTDVRKENLNNNCYSLSISKLNKISPIIMPVTNSIKTIVEKNPKAIGKLYRITNLEKNDSLKAMQNGTTFWGTIKKADGTSTMAKLKEVSQTSAIPIEPTTIMMSAALYGLEAELNEIKELNKKVLSFLEKEKESEIEADLETLNKFIIDFGYNLNNEKYLINNHKQIMDIKRTSNKNMLFYKKQIKDNISQDKLFTTNNAMNSIINEMIKKFKYYRLSLYTYSFSTLIEILLLGNYKSEYLLLKKDELNELANEYYNSFNEALEYIKKNANKSLESNVLFGIGNAEKAIGNLAEKIKVKNVDMWLNEKGENLKQTGQNLKDNFTNKFDEIKESNSQIFIEQIEKFDNIYNKTKEIYFDDENIYLETKK